MTDAEKEAVARLCLEQFNRLPTRHQRRNLRDFEQTISLLGYKITWKGAL